MSSYAALITALSGLLGTLFTGWLYVSGERRKSNTPLRILREWVLFQQTCTVDTKHVGNALWDATPEYLQHEISRVLDGE